MLYDKFEIDIVKNANEPGIRNPDRPRIHFERIIERFFKKYNFNGKTVLDIGPGHYDFCEITRDAGAKNVAIELDECVIKLGEYKNFKVIKADLRDPNCYEQFKGEIDFLFCRGSINIGWFNNNDKHQNYINKMLSVLKQDASVWVSPCNEPINSPSYFEQLNIQINAFKENGFDVTRMNKFQAWRYGIWSDEPKIIFTKNLIFKKYPW